MKIGLLSDTHGNLPRTKRVARLFAEHHVDAVLHSGDIGGLDILTELATLGVPVYAVLGNCDKYTSDWTYYPASIGIHLLGFFGEIELGGKKTALIHGDDTHKFNQSVSSGQYDLVISGHSHQPHDVVIGSTRCINPGAITRSDPPTCAVLDLTTGEILFCPI